MPSLILGNTAGGQNILSGSALWSGIGTPHPVGGVQLKLHPNASGNAYVALSGGMNINSGGVLGISGTYLSGLLDGMFLAPGDSYFIPKLGIGLSGAPVVFVACDAAASGQARMYFEAF